MGVSLKKSENAKIKLEREVTDAKRKEQEALQDQEVDATGKVDAERLQEEKERVEAEKSDASSKVAEAQEKAKPQIERVKEEAKNEVRQADKKAEKETQQAEKKMQEVEAKDATEGQPSGKKDAELKQMLKSLESGGETKKKESLIPANLVKATQGKLGNSV